MSILGGNHPKLLLGLLIVTAFPSDTGGWRIRFAGSNAAPVLADGSLFVGSADGAVYALDPATGATKWRFQTGAGLPSGPAITTTPRAGAGSDTMIAQVRSTPLRNRKRSVDLTPVVRDGTVFVGAGDFSFYALDAMTGQERWSYDAGERIDSIAITDDGTPYVVTGAGLHALDPSTGRRKWLFETLREIPPEQMNDVRHLGKRPPLGPVRGENALFLTAWPYGGPSKCFVYAVAPDSGTAKWVTELAGSFIEAPVSAEGLLLVAAKALGTETLYAIDQANGQVKWKVNAEVGYGSAQLVIARGTIYFKTDKRVLAVELGTGRVLWSFGADWIGPEGFVLDARHLYLHTIKPRLFKPSDTVHALDLATGHEEWSLGLRGGGWVRLVQDGVLYAGETKLHALDAATGRKLWTFGEIGRFYAGPLSAGGRLFLVSPADEYYGTNRVDPGYLYALDARTGKP